MTLEGDFTYFYLRMYHNFYGNQVAKCAARELPSIIHRHLEEGKSTIDDDETPHCEVASRRRRINLYRYLVMVIRIPRCYIKTCFSKKCSVQHGLLSISRGTEYRKDRTFWCKLGTCKDGAKIWKMRMW